MQNKSLAKDYIKRCESRLKALAVLYKDESWADVVRESQEAVELAMKSLLRQFHIEVPRIHDVSEIMNGEADKFPKDLTKAFPRLTKISKSLRRDRELAFYGSEDLTPSDFYSKSDAKEALESAEWVVHTIKPFIK